ncbi:hypothetical protein PR202_gb00906 [Eleusine coracana subsp. coracana]|uniref:Uncharacterized protein n=1 Tax=Eleusine coracana subsp. coracana TaxID=191504 RepID=A0AAV5DUZ9_ELECO|nr:hypothetical protein PR202_gb00906 [Eleusine coracana subsp. coracana]
MASLNEQQDFWPHEQATPAAWSSPAGFDFFSQVDSTDPAHRLPTGNDDHNDVNLYLDLNSQAPDYLANTFPHMNMSDDEVREEKELDLSSNDVVTKYKAAAEILNNALKLVVSECKPKAKIVDLCEKEIWVVILTVLLLWWLIRTSLQMDQSPEAADVLAAANTAAEVAMRLVRPGKKNKDVTEAIQKVAAAYDCKIVEGVLSHQLKQFVIDGNKVVLSVSNADTKVDDADFEENEVYAIDIVTSTGEGKPKLLDEKQTTIYKRAVDKNYHLKMKASRALEEKRARLGLVECMNHELLQPYPVLHEKPGDLVAHIKFTVLLMPNGSDRITSHPLQELQPTKSIEDNAEIKAWLALGTKTKKKGGGKKKKGKKGDAAEADTPMEEATNGAPSQE